MEKMKHRTWTDSASYQ